MKQRKSSRNGVIFLLFMGALLLIRCQGNGSPEAGSKKKTEEVFPGEALSQVHCKSCHLYPGPELLDRSTWARVLTGMENEIKKANYQLSREDWFDIQRYYLNNSPTLLEGPPKKKRMKAGKGFENTGFFADAPKMANMSTVVKFDQNSHLLFTGDMYGNLFAFSKDGLAHRYGIRNIPIDVESNPGNQTLEVLGIGSLMPSEERTGQLISIDQEGNQVVLVDSLKRPVHFLRSDLDSDGEEEYLICSFGSTTGTVNSGRLSLFVKQNGEYREQVVKEFPGALKSVVGDFNGDGRLDIMALFAQGKEIISMFLNQGNLEFLEKQLLEFLPCYGSNSFELADMNSDSHPDIVFTNGDNGDNAQVFKPYHAVRVFLNNGDFGFKEAWSYPLNGASKVIARDFDHDGDPDLAVLAMYPDLFSWPQEVLVYFENKGKLNFEPSYLEKEPSAKWLLMDAGDIDADGDDDLMVGANYRISALIPPQYKQKWEGSSLVYSVFTNVFPEK